MASYQDFIGARTTEPDPATLLAQLRALDATAGVQHVAGTQSYRLKKATAWTQPQITSAQNVIDTAPATSPQLTAQAEIDNWPIAQKALVVAITKQFNAVRSKLSPPLPDLTKEQVLAAIRTEAGNL